MLGLRSGEVNDALQSAKKAGLDTGDIITAVNGKAVRSTADLTSELAKTPAGSVVHRGAEWGPCYYDETHVLSANAFYELPVGRGKKFGSNWNSALNALVGNWQLSGIVQIRGGFPLTIWASDASGTNSRGPRANCNGPGHVDGGLQWFDPSPYDAPAPGTFGTCGVGTVRGPGLRTADLSLQKEFPIRERKRIEFRAEFINFTNTPIFGAPSTWLDPNLG